MTSCTKKAHEKPNIFMMLKNMQHSYLFPRIVYQLYSQKNIIIFSLQIKNSSLDFHKERTYQHEKNVRGRSKKMKKRYYSLIKLSEDKRLTFANKTCLYETLKAKWVNLTMASH